MFHRQLFLSSDQTDPATALDHFGLTAEQTFLFERAHHEPEKNVVLPKIRLQPKSQLTKTVEPEMVGDESEPEEEKIFDMFVSEISASKDKSQQEKIFKNFDKVATLAGDKEAREKINLHYTKMAGVK